MANESQENKTAEDVNAEDVINETTESVEESVEEDTESVSEEQQKINELELALATAQQTVADQKDSVIRAKAEVDNVRRRAAQDVEKARKFALEKFSAELLPVIDNLERAIDAYSEEEKAENKHEGVELTLQGFLASLAKFDIEAIDPKDQPFNPELHQAMSMQEIEGVAPNTVIAVMQKGYSLSGRLIRPAMVMVSKASANSVDTQA